MVAGKVTLAVRTIQTMFILLFRTKHTLAENFLEVA